jgi:hypothetical protein
MREHLLDTMSMSFVSGALYCVDYNPALSVVICAFS